ERHAARMHRLRHGIDPARVGQHVRSTGVLGEVLFHPRRRTPSWRWGWRWRWRWRWGWRRPSHATSTSTACRQGLHRQTADEEEGDGHYGPPPMSPPPTRTWTRVQKQPPSGDLADRPASVETP